MSAILRPLRNLSERLRDSLGCLLKIALFGTLVTTFAASIAYAAT